MELLDNGVVEYLTFVVNYVTTKDSTFYLEGDLNYENC